MAVTTSPRTRVFVDGKFFRLGDRKFYVKGVAYGPLSPATPADDSGFAGPEQSARDLDQIRDLGANVVRVYHTPPRWFLDLADARQLKVLIDIPWNKHLCFDSSARRAEAVETVRRAVSATARHPAVFAYSIANEIPAEIVRWMGVKDTEQFIDELVLEAKRIDPDALCTFTNFPPTEFLNPQAPDFVSFNVYLHHEAPFKSYLARLQMIADAAGAKPLVLGEFGIDSLREGEESKCVMLSWQIEGAFRAGLAGTVVFTYTDEWFKDGRLVDGWQMGLTTVDRKAKPSFAAVQKKFGEAPYFPLPRYPQVSIVVASYNGDRTLKLCLESLRRLNYPNYEIILVDDGSNDTTRLIAAEVGRAAPAAQFRYIRHEQNLGLSIARNTGIGAAQGEIVAFTDSDCRADEDWLYYLVASLLDGEFAGMGGPNLLPPDGSRVSAAVMASPGGPAHVMLTDREAEHIPGCNMAFYKRALEEVGGFDPIFTKAGDDVDVCWRVQQAGYRIGFSAAGFVWHYRRSTVPAYLRQQRGYGEAEAMLVRKHPENFNVLGGGLWHGRIYSASRFGVELRGPVIYHGRFGSAGFQKMYTTGPAMTLMLCTALEYHLFVAMPLWILSALFYPLLPLAILSLLLPIGICVAAAAQATLPNNKQSWWSRPLVAFLFFHQPIVRGLARYRGRIVSPGRLSRQESIDSLAFRHSERPLNEVQYWAGQRIDRLAFIGSMLRRLDERGWPNKSDVGWSEYDVDIYGSRWSHLQVTTVAEDHPGGRQLVRCRLRAVWSLMAKVALCALAGVIVLIIGLIGVERFWPWLLWALLPLFAWFIIQERRHLQSVVTVFLDELARESGLTKIHPGAESK